MADTNNKTVNVYLNTGGAERSLKSLTAESNKLNNEIRLLSPGTQEFRDKAAQLISVNGHIKSIKNEISGTRQEIIKASNSLSGFKGALTGALTGTAFIEAGRQVLSFFKDAVQENIEFKRSLSDLSAITGATGKDLRFYASSAKQIGKDTGTAGKDIVEAFKLIGGAKPELLSQKEALVSVTKEALILAKASGQVLPEAAKSLTDALNQFSAPAEEASRYINALAAGSKEGAAEVPDITEALLKFGVGAKSLNVDIEESVALIETLADKGVKGAEAGTAIRNILAKISAPDTLPKEAVFQLEQLGVNLNKVADTSIPLSARLRELSKIQASSSAIVRVFGLENKNAAEVLLGNIDRYEELTQAVTGTKTAYEQAAIATDNLAGDWDKFIGAVSAQSISFADSSDGMARSFVQTATEIVKNTDSIIGVFDNFIDSISRVVSSFGSLFNFGEKLSGAELLVKGLATSLNMTFTPLKLLFTNLQLAGDSLGAFLNKGKEVANFFGADFKIDENATFSNALKRYKDNIVNIGTSFSDIWTDNQKKVDETGVKIEASAGKTSEATVKHIDTITSAQEKAYDRLMSKWNKFNKDLSKLEEDNRQLSLNKMDLEIAKSDEKFNELLEKAKIFQGRKGISEKEYQDVLDRIVTDREIAREAIRAEYAKEEEEKKRELNDKIALLSLQGSDKEIEEVRRKYEQMIKEAEKYGLDSSAIVAIRENEIAAIVKKYDDEAQKNKKASNDELLEKDKKLYEAKTKLLSDFSNLATASAEFIEATGIAGAKTARGLAVAAVAIDTAKALSSTIAGASAAAAAGGPAAPYLLAGYIASGVATVLGAYVSVNKILGKGSEETAGLGISAGTGPTGRANRDTAENGTVSGKTVNTNAYATPANLSAEPRQASADAVIEAKQIKANSANVVTVSPASSVQSNTISSNSDALLIQVIAEQRATRAAIENMKTNLKAVITYEYLIEKLNEGQAIDDEANI